MKTLGSPSRQAGFTLIELMIVVVIVAIVMAVGLPSFQSVGLSNKLRNYSNEIVAASYLARSEAIKRNAAVTLCVSTDGSTCAGSGRWDQGWIVLNSSSEVIKAHEALSTGFKFSADEMGASTTAVNTITFNPSGLVSPATDFTLCRKTPTVGEKERELTVYATGRTRVVATTNGTCS